MICVIKRLFLGDKAIIESIIRHFVVFPFSRTKYNEALKGP